MLKIKHKALEEPACSYTESVGLYAWFGASWHLCGFFYVELIYHESSYITNFRIDTSVMIY